jgi:hypothetical protein
MKALVTKMKSKRSQTLIGYALMAAYVVFAIRVGTIFSQLLSAFSVSVFR